MRYWIKLYTEIIRDPKMGRLTDRQFRTCINLFALAGMNGDDGSLPPLEDMAWHLRMDPAGLETDLAALAAVGIVEDRADTWYVRKWAERQAKAPSDDKEAVRKRVAESRARKRNESVTTLQPGVTIPEAEADTETETEAEEGEKDPPPPPALPVCLSLVEWAKTQRVQYLQEKDRELIGGAVDLYGDENVVNAIDYCWKHKKTPYLQYSYLEATLIGWQTDGKLYSAERRNGNGHIPAGDQPLPSQPPGA